MKQVECNLKTCCQTMAVNVNLKFGNFIAKTVFMFKILFQHEIRHECPDLVDGIKGFEEALMLCM